MKTTFNNIEGDIEIRNQFAQNLLETELKLYQDAINDGIEEIKVESLEDVFTETQAELRNEAVREGNKRILAARGALGWVCESYSDLADFSFVGLNLRFDFKPQRDLMRDKFGDVCTNVLGEVEISLANEVTK